MHTAASRVSPGCSSAACDIAAPAAIVATVPRQQIGYAEAIQLRLGAPSYDCGRLTTYWGPERGNRNRNGGWQWGLAKGGVSAAWAVPRHRDTYVNSFLVGEDIEDPIARQNEQLVARQHVPRLNVGGADQLCVPACQHVSMPACASYYPETAAGNDFKCLLKV